MDKTQILKENKMYGHCNICSKPYGTKDCKTFYVPCIHMQKIGENMQRKKKDTLTEKRNKWKKADKTRTEDPVKPEFKINKDGFRKDLNDYFKKYMFTYKKQISPFIVIDGNNIYKKTHTNDLFGLPDTATIFHTWPGKYKSDVFVFTIREMFVWMHAQKIDYIKMHTT